MKNISLFVVLTLAFVALLAADSPKGLVIQGQEVHELRFDDSHLYAWVDANGVAHVNTIQDNREDLEQQLVKDGFIRWTPKVDTSNKSK